MNNNLNSILIEGNLVRDAEIKATPRGTQVCKFSLASNRFYKGADAKIEQEVSYFEVETWGKLAESTYSQGKKGRGLRVVGRIKQNRWQDEEGKNHSRIIIVAEHVEFKPEFHKEEAVAQAEESYAEEAMAY
ncbi:MAG: single-stranded DNA-binding protein [Spirochaetaceae bacterium]|jgi:single-strand DNA-binding protein|nr:single-stranded DNA-binding protein [Spirochaetaceae bacterium]